MDRFRASLAGALTLLAAAGLSGQAAAFGKHGGGGAWRLERALDSLGLDEQRRASAFAVLDAAAPAQRELRSQARAAHEALRELLDQATPDERAVLAQAEQVSAIQLELRKNDLRTLLQVKALLTPDEQEQLQAAMRPRGGRGPGGRGEPPSAESGAR